MLVGLPYHAQPLPNTTLAVRAFKWLKDLPMSEPKRKVLTDNIAKTEEWWSHQPSGAIDTVERVAGHSCQPHGQKLRCPQSAAIRLTN